MFYEYGGRYYAYVDWDTFGEASWKVALRSVRFDGSCYYVEYDFYYGPLEAPDLEDYFAGHWSATLSLKTISGQKYWSLFEDKLISY